MKLLDCTLRDGGYHNKWNFTIDFAQDYLELMSELEIEFIEIGFRFIKNSEYLGPFAFTSEFTLENLKVPNNLKIGVMVNASDFTDEDLDLKIKTTFLPKSESKISFIRIAANYNDIEIAIKLSLKLKFEFGYDVFVNIMQMAFLENNQIEELKLKNFDHLECLYFADSSGSMTPESTTKFFKAVREVTKVPVGIHAHNNSGNAFANSLVAETEGAEWFDGTLLGMGRGPGNTKIEQLWIENGNNIDKRSAIASLISFLDNEMNEIRILNPWGERIEYHVAAKLGLHPTFVQNLIEDDLLSAGDRVDSINNISKKYSRKFSEEALNESQKIKFISKIQGTNPLVSTLLDKSVLILANSKQLENHLDSIINFAKNNSVCVFHLNEPKVVPAENIDFLVSCSPVRSQRIVNFAQEHNKKIIAPVEYLSYSGSMIQDSHNIFDYPINIEDNHVDLGSSIQTIPKPLSAIYALAVSRLAGVNSIYLAGFDGDGMSEKQKREMNLFVSHLIEKMEGVSVKSILETYLAVPTISVYGPI